MRSLQCCLSCLLPASPVRYFNHSTYPTTNLLPFTHPTLFVPLLLHTMIGIAEVASTKKDIDSKQSEFEDSINGALQSALADAAEKAAADNVALKGAVEQVKVEVSKEIDDVKKTADASGECAGSGLAWNGDKCVAQNIVVAVNAGLKCNGDNVGRVRFDKESKSMQLCNGEEWGSVGSSSAKPCVDKEYGSVECNPATSCQTLGLLGRVPAAVRIHTFLSGSISHACPPKTLHCIIADTCIVYLFCDAMQPSRSKGKVFYIGTLSYSSKWKCQRDKMWQVGDVDKTYGGVSFGDGSDGDFSCDKKGTIFINEVFPSYNPREHRIPQWKNVVIKDGCTLSVADFDGSGNSGGVLAFRASGKVTIQKGGQISVDRLGNRGGLAPGWKPSSELNHFYAPQGYSSNTESGRGVGDGGGYGGRGGGGWHGSGGGGGSFARKGGKGSPDKCRNNRGNHQFGYDHDNSWAPPGPEYMYKSNFFHPFEVMGSGGGAGGAGHPTQSESPAQNGGAGGGTMQIMAKDWANAGKLYARGEAGLPYKRFHYWPDKNAQVGSGGAGSGGFIKIMTGSAGGTGPYDIAGGAQPLVTNWCQRDHQRGGSGGNGRISHVKALKDA